MYADAKRIRKHRATMNLDDYEQGLVTALVNYTGLSQAQLLRKLVVRGALNAFGLPPATPLQVSSI